MPTFRKKPVVIEAERFYASESPLPFQDQGVCCFANGRWFIRTLEGDLTLTDGDWVIKGTAGEFYPCKPDIFETIYERVDQ